MSQGTLRLVELLTSIPAILSVAGGAVGWLWTQTRSLDKRITRIENSLAVLEERLRHVPDAREFAQLGNQLARTEQSTNALLGALQAVHKRLDRIEDWATEVRA